MYLETTTDANIVSCSFRENYGSAVYAASGSSFDINDSIFVANEYARERDFDDIINQSYNQIGGGGSITSLVSTGGALHLETGLLSARVRNSSFQNNATIAAGGAINTASKLTLDGCIFTNNKAQSYGGAIIARPASALATTTTSDLYSSYYYQYLEVIQLLLSTSDELSAVEIAYLQGLLESLTGSSETTGDEEFETIALEVSDCVFTDNTAAYDFELDAISYYSTGLTLVTEDYSSSASATEFETTDGYGGAVYLKQVDANVVDSHFIENTAKSGGALFASLGQLNLQGGTVQRNQARGGSGTITDGVSVVTSFLGYYRTVERNGTSDMGGGLVCMGANASVENVEFLGNKVEGTSALGGAINFYGGSVDHLVKNCLFSENQSAVSGGAISSLIYADPELINCTFIDNQASDFGGALYADWCSDARLTNCIVKGSNGYAIVEEDSSGLSADYCLFHDNELGDYALLDTSIDDRDEALVPGPIEDLGDENLSADPLLTAGPLGGDYLSQVVAGQAVDSPAIDAGSMDANSLGLALRTTATNGTLDEGVVDLGYHYQDHRNLPQYRLTLVTNGTGVIEADPNDGTGLYYAGTMVALEAVPSPQWAVGQWSGTVADEVDSAYNTVLMDQDRTVTMSFDKPRTIYVAHADYATLQHAIDDANSGDILILPSNTSNDDTWYLNEILVLNKAITLTSETPDNSSTVLTTVINDYDILITNSDAVIDGITFEDNSNIYVYSCSPTIRNCYFNGCFKDASDVVGTVVGADGTNGNSLEGGAITLYNASATIQNCHFANCYVIGGNGWNGGGGTDTHPNGYDGGWSGWAYGGAVFCGYNSDPLFEGCAFEGCYVRGGDGGNGGQANYSVVDAYGGRGGNVTWAESIGDTDAFSSPFFDFWDGWENMELTDVDGDLAYRPYWKYSGLGGAVYCESEASPSFVDCTFASNRAYGGWSGTGGYHEWAQNDPTVRIPDHDLKIDSFGGAVYATVGCELNFTNCQFDDNIADNEMDPNFAIDDGYSGEISEPTDLYFSYGGALYVEVDCKLAMTDCRIGAGEAHIGGGIFAYDSEVTLTDTEVEGSEAYQGGGAYLLESTIQMDGMTFAGNRAWMDPNLIPSLVDPNLLTDTNEVLDVDLIYGKGGALYLASSTVDIQDSLFKENKSTGSGGGLYCTGSDQDSDAIYDTTLHNCLITGNTAYLDGGGVSAHWYAGPKITNSTLTENVVTNGVGGGLYASYYSDVQVKDSILWNNQGLAGAQLAIGKASTYTNYASRVEISHTLIGPDYDPTQFDHLDEAVESYAARLAAAQEGSESSLIASDTKLVSSSEITSQFAAGAETVPVIVSLEFNQDTDWSSETSIAERQVAVNYLQGRLISSMDGDHFTIRHQYKNMAMVSADVTQSGLTALANSSFVKTIEPVRQVHDMMKQALPMANATEIREHYPGANVAIAIVDSGVDYTHPALGGGQFPNDKVIGGYDTANDDDDPMPTFSAHGTACSGIAAGSYTEYGDYIGGVAYDAKIYALKAMLDENTAGTFFNDHLLAAWEWCLEHYNDDPDNPIKVISNSWGGSYYTSAAAADANFPAFTTLVNDLTNVGILVIAASGNNGFTDGMSWPAAMSGVLSVGAINDTSGQVTSYSNSSEMLDVFAPADPVCTTDIVGSGGYTTGNYTAPYLYATGSGTAAISFNGTSSACPFVAGAIACIQDSALQRLGRYLTPDEVRALLVETGDPLTDVKVTSITRPRVNLGRAIAGASAWPVSIDRACQINDWTASESQWYETWQQEWDVTGSVLTDDPCFVGDFYLLQSEEGQFSPAVNAGSAESNDVDIALDDKTTSISGDPDTGIVDLGYHHVEGVPVYSLYASIVYDSSDPDAPHGTLTPAGLVEVVAGEQDSQTFMAVPDLGYKVKVWKVWSDANDVATYTGKTITVPLVDETMINVTVEFEEAASYSLTIMSEGKGSISPEPGVYTYYDGTTVTLTATPDEGYEVESWSGSDDDDSTQEENTVTIDGADATVKVVFAEHVYKTWKVGSDGEYQSIQEALDRADDGDTIIVGPGTYVLGEITNSAGLAILILDKDITVQSENPGDPDVVAQTIIDGGLFDDTSGFNFQGVVFDSNATSNTILNGFTIQNCGGRADHGDDGEVDADAGIIHPDGYDGYSNGGSAVRIMPGASPVIKNCVIQNNRSQGGNGGDGLGADDTYNAGRGGWGGWARGGAVYIGTGASPVFQNCIIRDNVARGGNGGNGGAATDDGGYGNYGGNYYPSFGEVINIGPIIGQEELYDMANGDPNLWEVWEWSSAESWYFNFEGRSQREVLSVAEYNYVGPPRWYSGYGGGVFCSKDSVVSFIDLYHQR